MLILNVDVSAVFEKNFDGVEIAAGGSPMDGRVAAIPIDVISTKGEQPASSHTANISHFNIKKSMNQGGI